VLAALAAALIGVLPLAASRALAQNATGVLAGAIYDPTGGVLPQVQVTLADGQLLARARTDASGRFQFTGVAPGRYSLTASLAGFDTLERTVDLQPTGHWEQPITLQVGTLQETISVTARRAAAPPASGARGTGPVRIGGNIRAPRKLVDVKPVYPPAMRDAGVEGVVPLEALIGRDGHVASVHVVSALVHPDLAQSAIDAVRQWRFEPVLLNGEAVEAVMTVTVRFSLTD
jgi:protein TonB